MRKQTLSLIGKLKGHFDKMYAFFNIVTNKRIAFVISERLFFVTKIMHDTRS